MLMKKLLFVLIVLALFVLIFLRIRNSPDENPPIAAVSETEKRLPHNAIRPMSGGMSRLERLMQKAENRNESTNIEGLREFVKRVEPKQLSFREIDSLLESLREDFATGLLLMDRVWEHPDRNWNAFERMSLRQREGYFAAKADRESVDLRLEEIENPEARAHFVEGYFEAIAEDFAEDEIAMRIENLAMGGDQSGIDLSFGDLQNAVIQGAARTWGKRDAEAARAGLERLENPTKRAHALRGLVAGWASEDAESAFEYALASADFGDALIVEAAASLVLSNPQKASEWVVQAELIPKQKIILEQSIAQWAEDDFDAAADWAMLVSNTDLRDVATISLVDTWAKEDPQKATQWAAAFPTLEAKARMLERSLPQWARANPAASAAWLDEMPVDIPTIVLLRKTLETLGNEDLDGAREWLEKINEPALKQIGRDTLQTIH